MRSKELSYDKQIKMLKQAQRRQEIEQKLTSMRFSQELKYLISEQSQYDDREAINKVQEQYFSQLLDNQKIDQIYKIIMSADFQTIKMIQKYSQKLIQLLLSYINTPQGIISLTNLIKKSQLTSLILYQMRRFDMILDCLRKNSPNSYEQNVYLVCISQILQLKEPYLKTINQQPLLTQVEIIFKQSLQRQKQDNIIITIIKILLEECNPNLISQSFLSAILSHFWTAKNMINIANLYITAILAIQRQAYRKSLTIILNIVQIVIRGRNRINVDLQSKIKPVLQILTTLFINYNHNWSEIDINGELDIEGNGNTIKIGLHDFFLRFEAQIFQVSKIDQQYCIFLRQFSRNCEGQGIFKVLNENGMISYLIDEMTSSAIICQLILKAFFVIIFKNSDNEVKEQIIYIMKHTDIQKSISLCMIHFQNNEELYDLASNLLNLLVIKIK